MSALTSLLTKQETKPANRSKGKANSATERFVEPKKRYHVGKRLAFAFDDESIQMAAALHYGKGFKLLAARKCYLSKTITTAEARNEQLAGFIKEFVEEFGGRNPNVSLVISGVETVSRNLILPHMKKSDLESAVVFEARKQVPFKLEESYYDFRASSVLYNDANRKIRLSFLAALKKTIDSRLEPFRLINVPVSHVYHAQDAIAEVLPHVPGFTPTSNFSLLNIDKIRSEMSYYRGRLLQFSHVISLGSSFLANRVDATMYEYFAESLATEIQNSLDYYAGQYNGQPATDVYVYGDLAYAEEIIELLSDRFGFVFRKFPTEQLSFAKKLDEDTRLNVAICLPTIAAAINGAYAINLLPGPLKAIVRRKHMDRVGLSALTAASIILGGYWATENYQLGQLEDSIASVKSQTEQLRASPLFQTYTQLQIQTAQHRQYLEQAKKQPSYLRLALKELTHLTPAGVRLYNLDIRPENILNTSLAGVSVGSETPPELALASLIQQLRESQIFKDVSISSFTKRHVENRFELEFQISMRTVL